MSKKAKMKIRNTRGERRAGEIGDYIKKAIVKCLVRGKWEKGKVWVLVYKCYRHKIFPVNLTYHQNPHFTSGGGYRL